MTFQDEEPKNVWQWLCEQGYRYCILADKKHGESGYSSPCGLFFFTDRMTYLKPGEIIFFLRTGHVRDMTIFKNSIDSDVLRHHRDGRCVPIRRVK